MRRKPARIILLVLMFGLIPVGILVSLTIGTADISAGDAFRILASATGLIQEQNFPRSLVTIIMKLRFPRIIMSLLVGAALGTTGTVLQGVFRNPMADPYIMGISAGAALGVTVGILAGITHPTGIQIVSFSGAMLSLLLVLGISGISGNRGNPFIMLISGLAVSFFFTSLMSLLMYLNKNQAQKILFWTFGSLSGASWNKIKEISIFTLIGIIFLASRWKSLNILSQGDETARSLGINPEKERIILLIISSLITALCVSVSGIIGFAGLMIPHAMRMLTGSDHKTLFPFAALGGALFLLAADSVGRVLLSPSEIPVGIVTSLLGAPYLLGIIFLEKRKRQ